ncbi:hypothetical protein JXA47_00935 [Candidatus Sumerlaeota bacterium]|nr:hypothetical protein [Candidatus Sumerlaeota bacterium]
MARDVVLFLSGISGCCLLDRPTGKITWGRPGYLLGWRNYYISQRPFRPGEEDRTTCGPVIDFVWLCRPLGLKIPFYEKCFRVLRERAGRRQGDIALPSTDRDFYPWPYDWRQSLVHTAQCLDRTVERLIELHQDPDLKITLVCHSSGGLAARYWWAYGARDVLGDDNPPPPHFPRRRNLGRLIHVGVPNRGTIKILCDLTRGINPLPLSRRYWPDFLFSMPSLYETFPFETAGRFVDERDEELTVDLFDIEEHYRRRLGLFTLYPKMMDDADVRSYLSETLPRARRFQEALRHPWPDEIIDTVHIVSGKSFETLRRVRLTPQGVDLRRVEEFTRKRLWEEGSSDANPWVERGDWFASDESLTGLAHRPGHRHEAHCVHRHLFSDPEAQRSLVKALVGD